MVNPVENRVGPGFDEFGEANPTQENIHIQNGGGNNVELRHADVGGADDLPPNEARPTLGKPTIDPSNDAEFYGSFESVLADLKKMAEKGEVDPAIFTRFEGHINQLRSLLKNGDLEGVLIALLAIMTELRAVLKEVGLTDLQHQNEATREKHAEQLDKLLESLESLEKAKKGGVFSEVFGWIMFVATAVFLGATLLASGGLTAPVVLAGIGMGITLLMQADSMLFDNAMLKGFTGGDEKAMQTLTYVMMGISIALMLGSAFASYRAATAATRAGANGAQAGQKSLEVLTEVDRLKKTSEMMQKLSFYVGSGAAIGNAATQIYVAKHEKDASFAEADLKIIEAALRKIDEMISMLTEMLKTVQESETATAQFVSDMVKMLKDTKNHVARTLA